MDVTAAAARRALALADRFDAGRDGSSAVDAIQRAQKEGGWASPRKQVSANPNTSPATRRRILLVNGNPGDLSSRHRGDPRQPRPGGAGGRRDRHQPQRRDRSSSCCKRSKRCVRVMAPRWIGVTGHPDSSELGQKPAMSYSKPAVSRRGGSARPWHRESAYRRSGASFWPRCQSQLQDGSKKLSREEYALLTSRQARTRTSRAQAITRLRTA